MTKNISVIDENGNAIGTTYPKRAKGLIKSGRAQRICDYVICLMRSACNKEDVVMNENIDEMKIIDGAADNVKEKAEFEKTEISVEDFDKAISEDAKGNVDIGLILTQLNKIQDDKSHIKMAMDSIEKIPYDRRDDQEARLIAISDIVKCRETTNQKMIELYNNLLMTGIR